MENVLHVLNNEAWLWGFELFGKEVEKKENVRQCFFPNHENICIHTMKSIMDLGSDDVKYGRGLQKTGELVHREKLEGKTG